MSTLFGLQMLAKSLEKHARLFDIIVANKKVALSGLGRNGMKNVDKDAVNTTIGPFVI